MMKLDLFTWIGLMLALGGVFLIIWAYFNMTTPGP